MYVCIYMYIDVLFHKKLLESFAKIFLYYVWV